MTPRLFTQEGPAGRDDCGRIWFDSKSHVGGPEGAADPMEYRVLQLTETPTSGALASVEARQIPGR